MLRNSQAYLFSRNLTSSLLNIVLSLSILSKSTIFDRKTLKILFLIILMDISSNKSCKITFFSPCNVIPN